MMPSRHTMVAKLLTEKSPRPGVKKADNGTPLSGQYVLDAGEPQADMRIFTDLHTVITAVRFSSLRQFIP